MLTSWGKQRRFWLYLINLTGQGRRSLGVHTIPPTHGGPIIVIISIIVIIYDDDCFWAGIFSPGSDIFYN